MDSTVKLSYTIKMADYLSSDFRRAKDRLEDVLGVEGIVLVLAEGGQCGSTAIRGVTVSSSVVEHEQIVPQPPLANKPDAEKRWESIIIADASLNAVRLVGLLREKATLTSDDAAQQIDITPREASCYMAYIAKKCDRFDVAVPYRTEHVRKSHGKRSQKWTWIGFGEKP